MTSKLKEHKEKILQLTERFRKAVDEESEQTAKDLLQDIRELFALNELEQLISDWNDFGRISEVDEVKEVVANLESEHWHGAFASASSISTALQGDLEYTESIKNLARSLASRTMEMKNKKNIDFIKKNT